MIVEPTAIPGVLLLTPPRFLDERGFFSETWNERRFTEAGIPGPFVQDNHARSADRGVVRGLHLQIAPSAAGQADARRARFDLGCRGGHPARTRRPTGSMPASCCRRRTGSSSGSRRDLLHGYCTLEPDTEVIYKVTAPWDRQAERGVIWNDPTLAIPVADRAGRGDPVRQGPRPAAAGGVRRVAHAVT